MIAPGLQPVNLGVQHQRHHDQWMPVRIMDVSKRPTDSMKRQTLYHLWVLIHIHIIIEIDEPEMERLVEDQKDGDCQQQAHARNHALVLQA